MRKTLGTFLFFVLAAWCWGQTAPTAPAPDSQSAAPPSGPMEHRHRPGVAGTITAINGDSLTVKTMNGQTAQVTVSDKTQYRKDRQQAKLADFKVGDQIFVRGESSGGMPGKRIWLLPDLREVSAACARGWARNLSWRSESDQWNAAYDSSPRRGDAANHCGREHVISQGGPERDLG